jgi:hypothetical protein
MLIRFNIHHDKLPEFIMWFKQHIPYTAAQVFTLNNQIYTIEINFEDAQLASFTLLRYNGTVISSNQETVEFIGKIIC